MAITPDQATLEEWLRRISAPYADKTSFLMRTTYRDEDGATRFLRAFEEAIGTDYDGDLRYAIKQQVGSILGSRPKKARGGDDSVFPKSPSPTMIFTIEKQKANLVILISQFMGGKLTYVRNQFGEVVNGAFEGHPGSQVIALGKKRAEEIFAEMDTASISAGSITLGQRSSEIITMVIGGVWKMVACRGRKDVIAQVSEIASGKPVPQNTIPPSLLAEARGIANWWLWRDNKTGRLL